MSLAKLITRASKEQAVTCDTMCGLEKEHFGSFASEGLGCGGDGGSPNPSGAETLGG